MLAATDRIVCCHCCFQSPTLRDDVGQRCEPRIRQLRPRLSRLPASDDSDAPTYLHVNRKRVLRSGVRMERNALGSVLASDKYRGATSASAASLRRPRVFTAERRSSAKLLPPQAPRQGQIGGPRRHARRQLDRRPAAQPQRRVRRRRSCCVRARPRIGDYGYRQRTCSFLARDY
jgi:hypothetical protein